MTDMTEILIGWLAVGMRTLLQVVTHDDLVHADVDGDGHVDEAEFVLLKLRQMGVVAEEDISLCRELFHHLVSERSRFHLRLPVLPLHCRVTIVAKGARVCVLKLRAEMPDVLCRAGPHGHSFILYRRYRSRMQIMTATSATMSCCCSSRATTRH